MKVWITKYALTDGIIEEDTINFLRTEKQPSGLLNLYDRSGNISCSYKKGEYFGLKELAIKKAAEMRKKKIESLKKQIKKLEEMRFE